MKVKIKYELTYDIKGVLAKDLSEEDYKTYENNIKEGLKEIVEDELDMEEVENVKSTIKVEFIK